MVQPSRRMAPREREELVKHTQDFLEKGLIRPSFSCQGSAAVFVTKSEVKIQGNIVSGEGISVDPVKVETILEWKQPKTPTEVHSFLGLAGYYRKFIRDFAKISALLTCLTKKNMTFMWDVDCEDSFTMLKRALTSAPVLVLPDGAKPFTVYMMHLGWVQERC